MSIRSNAASRRLLSIASSAALAALAWSAAPGCGKASRRVVVGVAVSKNYHPAVRLAAEQINAAGGVAGARLELVGLEDDAAPIGTDAASLGRWSDRFDKTSDLVAIVGPSDSTSALAVARAVNERRIPQIVTIATHPLLTNIGPWTYRICVSDAAQGPALAEFALQDWGKKRVAIFAVGDDYGRGLTQSFSNRVRKGGGDVISTTTLPATLTPAHHKQLAATVAELKKVSPDLVAVFQRTAAARVTMKALRDAGLAGAVLGGDSLGSADLLKEDAALMNGARFGGFFHARPDDPAARAFSDAYRKATGTEADYGAVFAFDAVHLVRQAVEGGGATREGVKTWLDSQIGAKRAFEGTAGRYLLGPDHDARRPLFILEYRDGKQVLVKAIENGRA